MHIKSFAAKRLRAFRAFGFDDKVIEVFSCMFCVKVNVKVNVRKLCRIREVIEEFAVTPYVKLPLISRQGRLFVRARRL